MRKNFFIFIIFCCLIIILLFLFFRDNFLYNSNSDSPIAAKEILTNPQTNLQNNNQNIRDNLNNPNNVEIKEGVQYVTVLAKGGYFPKISLIKADLPTKLIIKTENTYDCTASLIIRSLDLQKVLSANGQEIIDLGILKSGNSIQGVCGMGMFYFKIQAI